MMNIRKHFNVAEAVNTAVKMLQHNKTFSETFSHIENIFVVDTSKVMETAIIKYRFKFA